MSVYEYRKTWVAPAMGVNYSVRPHLLAFNKWFKLQQMRCRYGLVTEFPGWDSILASGNAGGFGSLLTEYKMEDGTIKLIVGGPTKLFELDPTTLTLTDKSGAITFGPTRDYPWSAQVWANNFYASNKIDGLHKYTGTGNFAAVSGAPKLWNIRVIKNHFAGFGVDNDPMKFQWAAEGSETAWTALATNDAGSFRIVESSDRAVGLEPLHEELIGYKENSIHIFTFIGGREVIGRRRAIPDVGMLGPYAIAVLTDQHIFMGRPGNFYRYTGGTTIDDSIGDEIRAAVFDNIHSVLANRSRTLILPLTFEVMFMYPDKTSTNDCNKCVIYNYKEKHWTGPFDIAATMAGAAKLVFATTIDSHSELIDTVSDAIDTFGITTGESLRLFMDSAGDVLEVGASLSNKGTPITREAETGDLALGVDCEDHLGQKAIFPLSTIFNITQLNIEVEDASGGDIQLYIGSRRDLNDPIMWSNSITIKSAASQVLEIPVFGIPPGRWFRLRFILPNSERLSLAGYQIFFTTAGVR